MRIHPRVHQTLSVTRARTMVASNINCVEGSERTPKRLKEKQKGLYKSTGMRAASYSPIRSSPPPRMIG